MNSTESVWKQLTDHVRETAILKSTQALLEWDQQTMLPQRGVDWRAQQITWMAGQIHQRETDPRLGDWLHELADADLAADPHSESGACIRELQYRFNKKAKLPLELVEQQATAHSIGQQIWAEARKDNDFAAFAPHLEKIFALKREEAAACGVTEDPYDALLDDYETGALTEPVDEVLTRLKEALVPLIAQATDGSVPVDDAILHRSYPRQAQEAFIREVTAAIGFDYQRGRLDVAAHPFCMESGPHDCRMTTRYNESLFSPAFFGSLHEAGHGIYEQGLRTEQYGFPAGTWCSLGIHESQSRLWENLVGRSQGFWQHFLPRARHWFPESLADVSVDQFHRAVNRIQPSLIRVEADEATYNLHIIIRFELERALINNQLAVQDLPEAWNQKYREYLGITPPDERNGVLQDIHWSAGLVGYFPTYSLGNIYSSQMFARAAGDLGDLEEDFARGDFGPLLEWLRTAVHAAGNCYRSGELMQKLTGSTIDERPLIDHLRQKVDRICAAA